MTSDEKVALAERIAHALHGVRRNEWQKWMNYFSRTGNLERAVELARKQAASMWLRPEPKRAAQSIASVVGNQFADQLKKLPFNELEEVFGYVGRCLEIRKSEAEAAHQERPHPQQRPPQQPGRGRGSGRR